MTPCSVSMSVPVLLLVLLLALVAVATSLRSQQQQRYATSFRPSCWSRRPLLLRADDDGDDDRPKLTAMADDSLQKRSLVRPLEETTKQSATSSSSTSRPSSSSYSSVSSSSSASSPSSMTSKQVTGNSTTSGATRRAATFSSMSIEDLKGRMVEPAGPMKSWSDLPSRPEDLNGINPATTLLFSLLPAAASYVFLQISNYLTANFATQLLSSELYPVQRIAVVVRNLVVGLTTLAGGFCGIIGVGLFALGVTVAVGVAKGELDPSKDNATGRVK